jgi:hypothetical protein
MVIQAILEKSARSPTFQLGLPLGRTETKSPNMLATETAFFRAQRPLRNAMHQDTKSPKTTHVSFSFDAQTIGELACVLVLSLLCASLL